MRLCDSVLITANAHAPEQDTVCFVIGTHKPHPCLCRQQNLASTLVRSDQLLMVYCSI